VVTGSSIYDSEVSSTRVDKLQDQLVGLSVNDSFMVGTGMRLAKEKVGREDQKRETHCRGSWRQGKRPGPQRWKRHR
jgi:hypothetical protein